jgi:hypothetical protein
MHVTSFVSLFSVNDRFSGKFLFKIVEVLLQK